MACDAGSCEVLLVCSTCHVIVIDVVYYNKLEDPIDVEYDMLDLDFDAAALRKSPNSTSMTRWKDQLDPTLMDLYPYDCVFKSYPEPSGGGR
ncbi:2Fe-2S ferredoxin [Capsicum annuum]|nr:2Fe-2S ferredoxin [Capsicum annuum]